MKGFEEIPYGHGLGGAVTVLVCDGVFKRCSVKFNGDNSVMHTVEGVVGIGVMLSEE